MSDFENKNSAIFSKIATKAKKYQNIIAYVCFAPLALFSMHAIVYFYDRFMLVKRSLYLSNISPNNPLWYYSSKEILFLRDGAWFGGVLLSLVAALILVRENPKFALAIQAVSCLLVIVGICTDFRYF